MRTVGETRALVESLFRVVNERLHCLQNEGADHTKIEREQWRKKLIEDTLKAIQETFANN